MGADPQPELFPPEKGRIGTDESGKGDYFGPLVVAGVFLPEGQDEVLAELGVKDSKRTSDKRVKELAEVIASGYPHSVVAIGPEKYNDLYQKFRNLNRLLAWAHARVIENILETVHAGTVITDQFGDERYVLNALMKKGQRVELIQKVRAEEDMAVAAASILARAEFLYRLRALGQEAKIELPKGASAMVEAAAKELAKRDGPDALRKVAKLHFKITDRVLA
jgi:ribonuclease HIII